jgi:exodeoxyribonuclease VII large subunit
MAVPPRAELLADLGQKSARLLGALARLTGERRLRLNAAGGKLPDLPGVVGNARMRLDDRGQRLVLALPNLLAARRAALAAAESNIPDPHGMLAARGATLAMLELRHRNGLVQFVHRKHASAMGVMPRLTPAPVQARLREHRARLEGLSARLDGASYEAVLARGFALVRDAAGHPVVSAAAVKPKASLVIRFADGEAQVTAKDTVRQARLDL